MSPKLSEEFKREAEFSEKQSRLNFDSKNDVLANHLAGGASAFRHAATEVAKLEDKNEALTKRVEELEQKAYDLEMQLGPWSMEYVDGLKKQIAALESQLAWTPVAQGLPTEPGAYVMFSDGHPDMLDTWVLREGYWLFGKFSYSSPWREYTRFRRITLPEAT